MTVLNGCDSSLFQLCTLTERADIPLKRSSRLRTDVHYWVTKALGI
jgi:hypothetical protein